MNLLNANPVKTLDSDYVFPSTGSVQESHALFIHVRTIVEKFVLDLTDLLVCDIVWIREAVKELIATDLAAPLYTVLFSYLQITVNRLFEPSGDAIVTDRNTAWLENIISVVRLILERAQVW